MPLATLSPDGKTATVRRPCGVHWNPLPQNVAAERRRHQLQRWTSRPTRPGAAIFTAQLWNASLASALAWQQPWQGARWKILDTPRHRRHRHQCRARRGHDRHLGAPALSRRHVLVIAGLKSRRHALGSVSRLEDTAGRRVGRGDHAR